MSGAAESPSRFERIRSAVARAIEPAATGLPRWPVLLWFPAAVVLWVIAAVALRLSGTSSGAYWRYFGEGTDPALLFGTPRFTRSDEWLINQGWFVSQFQTGLQPTNPTFPGGLDVTMVQTLPTTDWSVIFRPELWGAMLWGLEPGIAWLWWIPGAALMIACYLFLVTLLPRRPLTAALVTVGLVFTPFNGWSWGPAAMYPIAWALAVMAAIRWMSRDPRRGVAWAWAGPVFLLTTGTGMGLYLPFIIPCVVITLAFAVGSAIEWRAATALPLRTFFLRLIPLGVAGAAAIATMAAWVLTRTATFTAIGSTVYPGVRTIPSGTLWADDRFFAGLLSAPFGGSLTDDTLGTILGSSSPVISSVPLVAVFLVPGLIALIVRDRRVRGRWDWISVCVLGALAVIALYLLVPGLDFLGKVLLFDRVPSLRFRIVFALLIPVMFALVVRHVDRAANRWFSWPAVVGAVLALLSTAAVAALLAVRNPEVLAAGPWWPLAGVLMAASAALVFSRRLVPWAAGALAAFGLVTGVAANPLYVGIVDLNDTTIGQAIDDVDSESPGRWVGIGGAEVMGMLMQSGTQGYSGMQTYPPSEMWKQIDPIGRYEENWNRLAHVRWEWGTGDPDVLLYQRDVIVATFDACSAFAQDNVDYVLTTVAPPQDGCLTLLQSVSDGPTEAWIYAVVPPADLSAANAG